MNTLKNFRNTLSQYIKLTTLLVTIISCQKEINLKIETTANRLLVDGEFTNEMGIHTIKLCRPAGILNETPNIPVSGAKVIITEGTDTIHFTESVQTGIYNTSIECAGKSNKTYILTITNIDIDSDGLTEEYTAKGKMPEPIFMDSLRSVRGIHPVDKTKGINNYCYFKATINGPDYIYKYLEVDKRAISPLSKRLGTGDLARFERENKIVKPKAPDEYKKLGTFLHIPEKDTVIPSGSLITFVCLNLNAEHFEFLKEFDNNTSYNWLDDNFYDQIKMPKNIPTNITPSNKAAGYFSVYSISRISKKLDN